MRTAIFVLCVVAAEGLSQTVVARTHTFPPGYVEAWPDGAGAGADRASYRAETDRSVKYAGTSSAHLASGGPVPQGFGVLSQILRADEYRGKRVRFTAYVKTKDVAGRGAGLWMRVDSPAGAVALDNMMNRPLLKTLDWAPYSVVLDVPADAVGFMVGVLLAGTGELWLDQASLDVVGSSVPVTAQPFPTPAQTNLRMFDGALTRLANPGFEPRP